MMAAVGTEGRRPIFVAIGGDSGTGKSTLAAGFSRIFGEERITTLCLDDYHGLDRRERKLIGITALDPRANNFFLMETQLLELSQGRTITKPVYDHHDGTFAAPEELAPREVVIVQGLHPFLVPGVRNLFDLKVWLDPEEDLKHRWKVQRDVAKRGYSSEAVEREIEARRPDVEAHIQPQRRFADLVVRFYRGKPAADDGHLNARITTRATLPRLNLNGLLDEARNGLRGWTGEDDGQPADIVEIDGAIARATVKDVEDRIWEHMHARHRHLRHLLPRQFGAFADGAMRSHHSDPLALTQLLLVHRILSATKTMLVRVPESVHEALDHGHELSDPGTDHEHL